MVLDPTAALMALLVVFMVAGLLLYERRQLRLGGVLVMPLLVLYALIDLAILPIFLVAAMATYVVGAQVHDRTLLYGRRLFVVYLVLGIAASAVFIAVTGQGVHGVFLSLLPGLFAFNLHREGRPLRGSAVFLGSVALFVALGVGTLVAIGIATPTVVALGSAQGVGALTAGGAGLVSVGSLTELLGAGGE